LAKSLIYSMPHYEIALNHTWISWDLFFISILYFIRGLFELETYFMEGSSILWLDIFSWLNIYIYIFQLIYERCEKNSFLNILSDHIYKIRLFTSWRRFMNIISFLSILLYWRMTMILISFLHKMRPIFKDDIKWFFDSLMNDH